MINKIFRKIGSFFKAILDIIVKAREKKAKAYLEYYKTTGRYPDWLE